MQSRNLRASDQSLSRKEAVNLEAFLQYMETEARRTAAAEADAEDTGMPSEFLRWELGLTLGQLAASRRIHSEAVHDLLVTECAVRTELMQMEQRTPRYATYRFPEREKFQRHLRRIEEERRRLYLSQHDRVRGLQDRMLSLLLKHRMLEGGT